MTETIRAMRHIGILAAVLVSTTSATAAAEKPRVAVLKINSSGIDKSVETILTEVLTAEIHHMGQYRVLSTGDIDAMIGFEKQKDMVGCDSASCVAEMGGALGVDKVVASNVGRVGGTYVVNVKLINIMAATTENRVYRTVTGEIDKVIETIRDSAHELFGLPQKAPAPTDPPSPTPSEAQGTAPPPAGASTDKPPPPPTDVQKAAPAAAAEPTKKPAPPPAEAPDGAPDARRSGFGIGLMTSTMKYDRQLDKDGDVQDLAATDAAFGLDLDVWYATSFGLQFGLVLPVTARSRTSGDDEIGSATGPGDTSNYLRFTRPLGSVVVLRVESRYKAKNGKHLNLSDDELPLGNGFHQMSAVLGVSVMLSDALEITATGGFVYSSQGERDVGTEERRRLTIKPGAASFSELRCAMHFGAVRPRIGLIYYKTGDPKTGLDGAPLTTAKDAGPSYLALAMRLDYVFNNGRSAFLSIGQPIGAQGGMAPTGVVLAGKNVPKGIPLVLGLQFGF